MLSSTTSTSSCRVVTCSAPVNIAVVKYWGKRDEQLILPLHSSLSGTLHQLHLKSVTTVMADTTFERDCIWLNGEEDNINSKRIQTVLKEIRKRIKPIVDSDGKIITAEKLASLKIHICSENNFPTASGLASSASGFACLVFALSQLFQIKESYLGELTTLARMGSGSACRSMYGGFVKWEAGVKPNGEDSVAVQIAPAEHWPLSVLILVASHKKKEISSTHGMETTVKTSDLIQYRSSHIVPARMQRIEKAIKERDFQTFGIETMKDSNEFHAVCLDTYPPIFYLNDISKKVIYLITKYNEYNKQIKAAYTFDAGPNAVIYCPPEYFGEVSNFINFYFPTSQQSESLNLPPELTGIMGKSEKNTVGIISTRIGPGPQVLSKDSTLLDLVTGKPKTMSGGTTTTAVKSKM